MDFVIGNRPRALAKLPQMRLQIMSAPSPDNSVHPIEATGAGRGRILIVEDERIVAFDIARSLTAFGYTIVGSVASEREAVDRALELKPDLILMDIHLKRDGDGVQAAAQIREHLDVPIVFLTAHSDDETLKRAATTGAAGYLVKPFSAPELRCSIEIAIHKHRIDTKLHEREQWLATTLQSIGDAVIATDAERRVNFLNPAAEALTGWTNEEATGKLVDHVISLVDEQTQLPMISPIGLALEQRKTLRIRESAALVTRAGAHLPITDTAAPILSARRDLLGCVMVFSDETAHRRARNEIERLNADLERRVKERTTELESANFELEAFSYSVAHDLRAPLRSIDGFSQMLVDQHTEHIGPEAARQLRQVRHGVRQMAALIDDLLRLSRIGRADRAHVDITELAEKICAELAANEPEHPVQYSIQRSMTATADAALLAILLRNLLENAWKFTRKLTDSRLVEMGMSADENGDAVFFVRDNGAGFNMAYSPKLFGAFQRLHGASEFEGNGIGLAIAQRVVKRHGGRIWAESTPDRGATFFFTLECSTDAL